MAGGFTGSFNTYPMYSGSPGAGNGDSYLKKLLGGSGGLFGLGDLATGGILSGAGALFSGLTSLFGGPSESEKKAREVYGYAQKGLGKDVLHPDKYMGNYMRSSRDRNQAIGERINRQFGLDSGVGQSEMAYRMEVPLAQFILESQMMNDQLKSSRDMSLLSLMGQTSQYMG